MAIIWKMHLFWGHHCLSASSSLWVPPAGANSHTHVTVVESTLTAFQHYFVVANLLLSLKEGCKKPFHQMCQMHTFPHTLHGLSLSHSQHSITPHTLSHLTPSQVDTHVHASSCMNQKHLLRFIKKKIKSSPSAEENLEVVEKKSSGEWLTSQYSIHGSSSGQASKIVTSAHIGNFVPHLAWAGSTAAFLEDKPRMFRQSDLH